MSRTPATGSSGDIQASGPLTPAVFFILFALVDGEKHGYAIMQDAVELSERSIRMGPGTLYTTLQRLLEQSLIEEVPPPPGEADLDSRRRYYRLTRPGRKILGTDFERIESLVRLGREKRLLSGNAG